MNNFDTSSTGTNIEFSIRHDTWLSQSYWNDFKDGACGDFDVLVFSDRQVEYIVVCDDKSAPFYKKSQLQKMKKSEVFDIFSLHEMGHWDENYYTKQELIDDILTISVEQYYKTHYKETRWHDLESDFTSYGHSQGDAVKVNIVMKDAPEYLTKNYITNLLWDCPIDAHLTVNDEEIELSYNTVYDFDKDEFYEALSKDIKNEPWHDEVLEFVKDTMPSHIPYD